MNRESMIKMLQRAMGVGIDLIAFHGKWTKSTTAYETELPYKSMARFAAYRF